MLAEELGYEDVDEFEDALKAPFKVFLANLPHIEVRTPADDPSRRASLPRGSRDCESGGDSKAQFTRASCQPPQGRCRFHATPITK